MLQTHNTGVIVYYQQHIFMNVIIYVCGHLSRQAVLPLLVVSIDTFDVTHSLDGSPSQAAPRNCSEGTAVII